MPFAWSWSAGRSQSLQIPYLLDTPNWSKPATSPSWSILGDFSPLPPRLGTISGFPGPAQPEDGLHSWWSQRTGTGHKDWLYALEIGRSEKDTLRFPQDMPDIPENFHKYVKTWKEGRTDLRWLFLIFLSEMKFFLKSQISTLNTWEEWSYGHLNKIQ